ncbi:MAG: hypothetical protein ACLSE8_10605 [Parasutterella sp.]
MKSLKRKTPQCLARDPKFKVLGRTIRRVFNSHHGSKPWLGKISFSFIGTVLISWINARSFSFSSQKFREPKNNRISKVPSSTLVDEKRGDCAMNNPISFKNLAEITQFKRPMRAVRIEQSKLPGIQEK